MNPNKPLSERLLREDGIDPNASYTGKSPNLEEKHRKQIRNVMYQTWFGWIFVLLLGVVIFFQLGAEYGIPQLFGLMLLPLALYSTLLLIYFENAQISDYIGLSNKQKFELIEYKERSLAHRRWTTLLLWFYLCYFAAKNFFQYADSRTWRVVVPYTEWSLETSTLALINLCFILFIGILAYVLIKRPWRMSHFQLHGRLIGIEDKLTELLAIERTRDEHGEVDALKPLEERLQRLEETVELLRRRIEGEESECGEPTDGGSP